MICTQRFIDEKQVSPACTTYQDPRTALTSIHRLQGMKRTPFGQSSRRFKVNQDTVVLPGIKSYLGTCNYSALGKVTHELVNSSNPDLSDQDTLRVARLEGGH